MMATLLLALLAVLAAAVPASAQLVTTVAVTGVSTIVERSNITATFTVSGRAGNCVRVHMPLGM